MIGSVDLSAHGSRRILLHKANLNTFWWPSTPVAKMIGFVHDVSSRRATLGCAHSTVGDSVQTVWPSFVSQYIESAVERESLDDGE